MDSFNESHVEEAALGWLRQLGYAVERGADIAPGEALAERNSFGRVILTGRLREAVQRLNPAIPEEAREEALRKVLHVGTPSLTQTNRSTRFQGHHHRGTSHRRVHRRRLAQAGHPHSR